MTQPNRMPLPGLKPKDLIGIPWMCAFALRRAGWWLRGENIWAKPNPMPESISDRCTTSHEQVFLLAKSGRYFYDAAAVAEESIYQPGGSHDDVPQGGFDDKGMIPMQNQRAFRAIRSTRNKRSVWTIATTPFPGAHFATFPPALVEPCVLAGTSARGCCVECGAPWERVISTYNPSKHAADEENVLGWSNSNSRTSNPQSSKSLHRDLGGVYSSAVQLGWWPTCRCELPKLPPYPKKPRHAKQVLESTRKADDLRHRRECAAVDAKRKELCDLHFDRPVTRPVVLDPFGGACTTAMVADRLQRDSLIVELNPEYAAMGRRRLEQDGGMFARAAE